jgi:hypothetical protein
MAAKMEGNPDRFRTCRTGFQFVSWKRVARDLRLLFSMFDIHYRDNADGFLSVQSIQQIPCKCRR